MRGVQACRSEAASAAEEATAAAVQHTLDKKALEQKSASLEHALQQKDEALRATEQALAQACASMEQQAGEVEHKLQAGFEIAASLRQMLEDKDVQVLPPTPCETCN